MSRTNSLFDRPENAEEPKRPARGGRNPRTKTHSGEATGGEMARVTVRATYDQLDALDRDRIALRRASKVSLDRTALIRALLEGYRRSGIDLVQEGVEGEDQLADLIERLLARGSGDE